MRPVTVIGGARRRCATCLLPLAVVVVPPAVVLPVANVPPVARLPLARVYATREQRRARWTAALWEQRLLKTCEMDGGAVGATVVDGGGSSEEG